MQHDDGDIDETTMEGAAGGGVGRRMSSSESSLPTPPPEPNKEEIEEVEVEVAVSAPSTPPLPCSATPPLPCSATPPLPCSATPPLPGTRESMESLATTTDTVVRRRAASCSSAGAEMERGADELVLDVLDNHAERLTSFADEGRTNVTRKLVHLAYVIDWYGNFT